MTTKKQAEETQEASVTLTKAEYSRFDRRLSVTYPGGQPSYKALIKQGVKTWRMAGNRVTAGDLMEAFPPFTRGAFEDLTLAIWDMTANGSRYLKQVKRSAVQHA